MNTVAPGVADHLALVARKAVLSNVDKGLVTVALTTLVTRIEAGFERFVVARAEVAGSWARETLLPAAMDPDEDIDLLVIFRERGHLPAHYLGLLHDCLQRHYLKSAIDLKDGQLRLTLLQGRIRLLPALESLTGVQIPGPGTSWVRIDPAAALAALQDKDRQHDGLILPVVRLVKYWNARSGHPFGTWDLEQRVLQHRFAFVPRKNLKAYWFDFMRGLIIDPAAGPVHAEAVRRMRRELDEIDRLLQGGQGAEALARVEQMLPIPARLLAGGPASSVAYRPRPLQKA